MYLKKKKETVFKYFTFSIFYGKSSCEINKILKIRRRNNDFKYSKITMKQILSQRTLIIND